MNSLEREPQFAAALSVPWTFPLSAFLAGHFGLISLAASLGASASHLSGGVPGPRASPLSGGVPGPRASPLSGGVPGPRVSHLSGGVPGPRASDVGP